MAISPGTYPVVRGNGGGKGSPPSNPGDSGDDGGSSSFNSVVLAAAAVAGRPPRKGKLLDNHLAEMAAVAASQMEDQEMVMAMMALTLLG